MMKKMAALLLALLLALSLSSVMAEEAAATDGTYQIVLTGNPTTGYSWIHVLSDDTVAEVAEEFLTGADVDQLAGIEAEGEQLSGEGGLYVFTVKGLKPGTTVLAFQYGQEWDEESTLAGLTLTLTVNEDLSVVSTGCAMGL